MPRKEPALKVYSERCAKKAERNRKEKKHTLYDEMKKLFDAGLTRLGPTSHHMTPSQSLHFELHRTITGLKLQAKDERAFGGMWKCADDILAATPVDEMVIQTVKAMEEVVVKIKDLEARQVEVAKEIQEMKDLAITTIDTVAVHAIRCNGIPLPKLEELQDAEEEEDV